MGVRNNNLLQEIMNRRILEDVLRPCLSWTSTAHLDVEEIHQAPIFNRSLKLLSRDFGPSGFENFKRLLLDPRLHPYKHPHGAAFIFTNSIDSTAKYLDDLLRPHLCCAARPRCSYGVGGDRPPS
ncbi:hypothetical protein A0H81_03828 [Grifola frondosa]|uniref:Uncharacterized protein n=1 Tax=Grifola frondosa TaxID=5627 RepID=A0A1C7MKW5_GRIFR|nr:hypothetical protein A0H81_03828 [Grifola frondosa]